MMAQGSLKTNDRVFFTLPFMALSFSNLHSQLFGCKNLELVALFVILINLFFYVMIPG